MTRQVRALARRSAVLAVLAVLAAALAFVVPAVATNAEAADRGRAEVGFGRWLDLRIGMTPQEAIATGKVRRGAGPCRTTNLVAPWNERGYLFFEQGRLQWLTLFTAQERTAGGVGVGSSLRALRQAHPRLGGVKSVRMGSSRAPYVAVRRGARTITYQFPTDARVGPRSRVKVVNLSGRSARVLRVAC